MSNCLKAAWNQGRTLPIADQQKPLTSAPHGRPPAAGSNEQPRNFKNPQAGGRVYCIEAGEEEGEDPHAVVSGTFVVSTLSTKVLFDAGATHSFINLETLKRITCDLDEMDLQLCVTTPIGSMYRSELIVRNWPIIIQKKIFPPELISLGIQGYDVIPGMDWMTKYQAIIDCKLKTLGLITP